MNATHVFGAGRRVGDRGVVVADQLHVILIELSTWGLASSHSSPSRVAALQEDFNFRNCACTSKQQARSKLSSRRSSQSAVGLQLTTLQHNTEGKHCCLGPLLLLPTTLDPDRPSPHSHSPSTFRHSYYLVAAPGIATHHTQPAPLSDRHSPPHTPPTTSTHTQCRRSKRDLRRPEAGAHSEAAEEASAEADHAAAGNQPMARSKFHQSKSHSRSKASSAR